MATRTLFATAAVLLSVPLVLGQQCIVCGGPGQTACDTSTKSCYECQRQALSMQSSPGMIWGGYFIPLDELITYVCGDVPPPLTIRPCTMLNAAGKVLVPDQKTCTECKQLCTTNSQCGFMVWNYIKVPASSVEAFDCSDPRPGVQITAPGEAYGHHGQCEGWNDCGDAATCALQACKAKGYGNLLSYGAAKACTEFSVCNLFDSIEMCPPSVEFGWGNWCGVLGVTDIVCQSGEVCPPNNATDSLTLATLNPDWETVKAKPL